MASANDAQRTNSAQKRFERLSNESMRVVSPQLGFFSGARASIGDIFAHRQLLHLFTQREVKSRYKDSVLGYLWTLVRPLVNLGIYYFAIGKVLGAERAIPDFAIYVFAGLTGWTLFSTIISSSTASILGNAGIVKKVYIPRETFPLASARAALVDFVSQFAILLVGALLIRGIPWISAIIYGPISFLVLYVWAVGVGLILAACNVYLRDIQYLVEVLLMIGFWLTPSVYSFEMIAATAPGWAVNLYLMNPTAVGVMGFQAAFWQAGQDMQWPSHLFLRLVIWLLIGLLVLFSGQRIFARLQRNFAQEL